MGDNEEEKEKPAPVKVNEEEKPSQEEEKEFETEVNPGQEEEKVKPAQVKVGAELKPGLEEEKEKPAQEEVRAESKPGSEKEKEKPAPREVKAELKPGLEEGKEKPAPAEVKPTEEFKLEGNIPIPEKEKDKSARENTCSVKKPFHIEVTSTKELPQEEVKPICEIKESESYKATKEEIEDSLLFIKNKLKDQPVNDKDNVFQDQDYDEVHTEESIVERLPVQNPNAAAK